MKLRDAILQSLGDQFNAKVHCVALSSGQTRDQFLLDLANNIAQGLLDEELLLHTLAEMTDSKCQCADCVMEPEHPAMVTSYDEVT